MARRLLVEIIGDSSSYERALRQSAASGKKFESSIVGSLKKANRAYLAFGGVLAAGTVAAGFKSTINAASDLNESINAVRVTFGEASDEIVSFGKSAAQQAGLSIRQLNQLVVPLGASLQNYGLSAKESADESLKLTQRAADMASVFNTDVPTALEAIQSALRGEADPIERFGVGLNEAAVQAEVFRLGLAKTKTEITANDKTLARLSLIYKQTAKFQGDFAATSDGAANKQRILRARIENTQATIGQKLLPAYSAALDATNDLIDSTQKLADFFDRLGQGATINLPKNATVEQVRAIRQELVKVGGEGSLAVQALDKAIIKMNASLFHTLDLLESMRGKRFDAIDGAADGGAGTDTASKAFELPMRLRIAQAQAEVTAAVADNVVAAKAIRDHIRSILGSLKGDKLIGALAELASAEATIRSALEDEASKRRSAAEREADARRKHAEAVKRAAERQRQAAEEAAQKIRDATDQARTEIGQLFQGPIAAPTELQRRQALGFAPPGAAGIAADIRAQTQQALRFEADLRRLRRAGVGQATITELRGLGTQALPQVEAILGTRGGARRDIINALLGRERAARKIGQMIVQSPVVHVNANRVTVSGQGRRKSPARSGRFAGE